MKKSSSSWDRRGLARTPSPGSDHRTPTSGFLNYCLLCVRFFPGQRCPLKLSLSICCILKVRKHLGKKTGGWCDCHHVVDWTVTHSLPSPEVWFYLYKLDTMEGGKYFPTLDFGFSDVMHFGQRNVWVCSLACLPLSWEEHVPASPEA